MFWMPNALSSANGAPRKGTCRPGIERAVCRGCCAGNRLVVVGVAPVRHVVRLVNLVAPGVEGGRVRVGGADELAVTAARAVSLACWASLYDLLKLIELKRVPCSM